MINSKHILKMAKAAFRHDQGYPERKLIHPQREWFIGLAIFAVLLIGGSIAAGLLFLHYQNIDATVTVSEERVPTYQAGTVADVLALYSAREVRFNELQNSARTQAPLSEEVATTTSATTSTSSAATVPDNTAPAASSPSESQLDIEVSN